MPPKRRVKRGNSAALLQEMGPNGSSLPEPVKSSFATLPYDIKYLMCRQPGLKALDLLCLSHTNQAWYSAASHDTLFKNWYKVALSLRT